VDERDEDIRAPALAPAVRRRAGLGPGASVELRMTHASWVFIAGDHVWKVKRPVALGFLDFRGLEARRHFCEEELRLNRRLAPDVYLAVEPVRRVGAALVLGEGEAGQEGPTVDWAVHMRRLPDEESAAALVARGLLDAGLLALCAARVARFHEFARHMPERGAPAVLRADVEENFAESEPFVGDLLDRDTFDDARAFQLGWIEAHGPLLEARVAEGRICEGHGDLRLEHLYFREGADGRPEPLVIDCVEFSERFRSADVAAEVAFLAMELELVGRPDLAAGFVARYAEAADDLGLYGVLDFYLAYRAWVRGKVAALVAADAAAPADVRKRKALEARRDFALARAYGGRPLDAPFIVAVCGMIGGGKSTLAAALGRELAAPVVSSDVTRKAHFGLSLTTRGGPELYTEESRARVYEALLARAADVVGARRPVILDATFGDPARRADARRLAEAAGAKLVFVEVSADQQTLRARLAARRGGGSISDATDVELDELTRRYQAADPAEGAPVVRVDGGLPAERVADDVLAALRAEGVSSARERCRA
jgi:aminoglycoside phosphotransferase family enzyme/predicted kinase